MSTRIGFIGLGNMGGAMVRNLCRAGHQLFTYARSESRYEALADISFTKLPSPREVFATCPVVMLNVTATPDVHDLLLGSEGAINHAKAGTTVVDFSTIDGAAVKHMAAKLQSRQIDLIDCPVSGGTAGAQAATLTMMAGGNPTAFERVKPLLTHLGKTIRHVGPSGAGQAIKAANQMSMCIQLVGIAEAFLYAREQGADLRACYELLSAGLAGSKVLDWVGPHIVEGFSRPATIEARLHAKDITMVANSAQLQGLSLPLLQTTAKLLEEMMQAGLGNRDTSQLLHIIDRHLKNSQ